MGLTCGTIPEIKKNSIEALTEVFIGKSTNFTATKPGVIEMYVDGARFKSTGQLYLVAREKFSKGSIKKWSKKEHNFDYAENWIDAIDRSYPNKIVVYLKFPKALENILRAKDEIATLEDMNKAAIDNLGADYYMGDETLRHQNEMEMNRFTRQEIAALQRFDKYKKC